MSLTLSFFHDRVLFLNDDHHLRGRNGLTSRDIGILYRQRNSISVVHWSGEARKETTLPKFCFLKVSAICQAMRYVSKVERFRKM